MNWWTPAIERKRIPHNCASFPVGISTPILWLLSLGSCLLCLRGKPKTTNIIHYTTWSHSWSVTLVNIFTDFCQGCKKKKKIPPLLGWQITKFLLRRVGGGGKGSSSTTLCFPTALWLGPRGTEHHWHNHSSKSVSSLVSKWSMPFYHHISSWPWRGNPAAWMGAYTAHKST